MLRILHVVTNMRRGGLETMLMNYYRHIDRDKIQFDFLTHREEKADYDDEIESLGGKIYHLPRLVPWSASYKKALGDFFDEHPEYKIVHVHQDCLSSVALKVAKEHGISVRIAHSHSSNQDKNLKYPIKLFYMRFIPQYATQLFACGSEAGEWMFRGAPFEVLTNAIDVAAYTYNRKNAMQMRKTLGIAEDAFVIGHVGRFAPAKNHGFLVDVFAKVCEKDGKAVLLLVGDGGLMDEVKNKVSALGLQDKVIFTGVRGDVPDLMRAMDVFVLPSLYEGLAVVAVEAQSAGLPCVISDSIPADCNITDLVKRVKLEQKPEEWADVVLAQKGTERYNTYEKIVGAGFDIRENAEKLTDYYFGTLKDE